MNFFLNLINKNFNIPEKKQKYFNEVLNCNKNSSSTE